MARLSLVVGSTILATILFLAAAVYGHGPGGGAAHGGGHPGVGSHYGGFYYPHHGAAFYGPYRAGLYAPYGFYRPYYGLMGPGFGMGGLGFGMGLGMGLGMGGYGLGGYGLGGYGLGGSGFYRPYYGGTTVVAPTVVVTPPAAPPATAGAAPAQTPPPPDNAAHLQLIVPANAEVLFDGGKTTQSGTSREFVSPSLPAGKLFDYTIAVRYTDANGKEVVDERVIHVRANDWFRVDFTRPEPAAEGSR